MIARKPRQVPASQPTPMRQVASVTPPRDAMQIIPRHALLQLARIMHDVAAARGTSYAQAAA